VLVLVRDASDDAPVIACGDWEGRIAEHPAGDGGFGYDPLFLPADQAGSAAQLAPDLKNALSHRGKALAALVGQLR
jgi:XTP/dITP diphosphohydrolase